MRCRSGFHDSPSDRGVNHVTISDLRDVHGNLMYFRYIGSPAVYKSIHVPEEAHRRFKEDKYEAATQQEFYAYWHYVSQQQRRP